MRNYLKVSQKVTLILCILINILLFEVIAVIQRTGGSVASAQQVGQNCSLVQANCTWDAISGATSYSVKITEVETNTVIKTDTVNAPTTSYVFPVTQGKTYKCEVSAVNSCGASGPAGVASALCQTDAIVNSPTPSPALAACGSNCSTSSDCQPGLVCVTSGSGSGYCSMPNLQQQCGASPSVSSCCVPPTQPPQPTVAPTGSTENSIAAGIGVLSMIVIGIFFIWRSTL